MKSRILLAAAALLVLALHCSTLPRTFWEYDEHYFAMGIEKYEPLLHHPPPPGAPVYSGFAKLVVLLAGNVFRAMVATSVLFLIIGFLAYALASRELTGDVTGAVVLFTSPALLMSGVLPLSDMGAIGLLGVATWASARRNAVLCAIFCAAAAGWRPQLAVAAVMLFATTALVTRSWRAVIAFTIACLAWFVPLVVLTGGPQSFWNWLAGQAAYYAAHDAHLSRSGYPPAQIALRFLAHPWGTKWLALPVLALAAFGAWKQRRNAKLIPLAASCIAWLAFAVATMDPADAVRYSIPGLPLIAFLAASALPAWPRVAAALLYAAGSYWYAWPVVHTRAVQPSPPAMATAWIEKNVPRNAVILYDLPLRPHADHELRAYTSAHVEAGLKKYANDLDVPLVLLADGERGDAPGVTFRWPDTDAYRKLTRQHYGAVSVIPIPVHERFRVVDGIFAPERTRDGRAWRWVSRRGVLALPPLGRSQVRLTFRTPPDYPLDGNRIRVNGTVLDIGKDRTAAITVPFAPEITIEPERSFVPASIAGANNRDRRTLSVMLTRVEQLR